MADIPAGFLYTAEHEYVKPTADTDVVEVGITQYAQGELGDVVFVELPTVGTTVGAHDVFGTIEAVKAVAELFAPLAGTVIEVNSRLGQEPGLVNSDPYGVGWMVRLRLTGGADRSALLTAQRYAAHIGE